MIEVPAEFTTLAWMERHIQWCETKENLNSLTLTKHTINPGEEILISTTPNMKQSGNSMEETMNSRVRECGGPLLSPNETQRQDVSSFCSYIYMGFQHAEEHRIFRYEDWKLTGKPIIHAIEKTESDLDFYSRWVKELHQRYESALEKSFAL